MMTSYKSTLQPCAGRYAETDYFLPKDEVTLNMIPLRPENERAIVGAASDTAPDRLLFFPVQVNI